MFQGARKIYSVLAAVVLTTAMLASAVTASASAAADKNGVSETRVEAPLNLAVLIQDDLISSVGNELGVTRDFIRSLPAGSRVMVGYITSGKLQVRQPFTEDLEKAARSLRIPAASTSVSAFNPYVEVLAVLLRS